jgi:predicted transposase YdaD
VRLALLTLAVRPESDLVPCCRRVLALRPELLELILPRLGQRFASLSNEEIMATIGRSRDRWRHTRAFQEILEEGLQEGRQKGLQEGVQQGRQREAAALSLRLLARRVEPLDAATTDCIEALALNQLEDLSHSLLDFDPAADLQHWLEHQEA